MRLQDIGRNLVALVRIAVHHFQHRGKPIFRTDYVTQHQKVWLSVLGDFQDRPARILEIGSYEGRSALFFLDALPQSRITCIDTFPSKRSIRFNYNTRHHRGRVTKMFGRSAAVLDRLVAAGKRYDIIYIDGSHRRINVLTDSVLTWELLELGGMLIWDDYLWGAELPADMRPKQAIDVFCTVFAPCFRMVEKGNQVIVRKIADWPQGHPLALSAS